MYVNQLIHKNYSTRFTHKNTVKTIQTFQQEVLFISYMFFPHFISSNDICPFPFWDS